MTPLSVRTTEKGELKLNFSGVESFNGVEVFLLNTITGEQQNLKLDDEYTFHSDGNLMEGTLFIEFRAATVSNITETEACYGKCVSVFAQDGHVYVNSPPDDKIMSLTIWEQSGVQLYRNYNLNQSSFDIQLSTESEICMARVQTEDRVYVIKLFMK